MGENALTIISQPGLKLNVNVNEMIVEVEIPYYRKLTNHKFNAS